MMQQMFLGLVPSLTIEDLFSVDTYTGNGTSQTITNGIDLSGDGGLVWIKHREVTQSHLLTDSEKPLSQYLYSDTDQSNFNNSNAVTAFNSNGFSVGNSLLVNDGSNNSVYNENHVAWTFRKAPGFFDVVTWTGDGVTGRTISHNLGETPGLIIIKAYDTASNYDWLVWHPDLTNDSYHDKLNIFGSQGTAPPMLTAAPTSTSFSISNSGWVNDAGGTIDYIAYVFANNNELIKCSSYTGNGSTGQTINVGFEAQWVLIKNLTRNEDWVICDSVRTYTDGSANALFPNTSGVESNRAGSGTTVYFQSNGFSVGNWNHVNNSGDEFMYMAIAAP